MAKDVLKDICHILLISSFIFKKIKTVQTEKILIKFEKIATKAWKLSSNDYLSFLIWAEGSHLQTVKRASMFYLFPWNLASGIHFPGE